ncbi:hypothetical protein [Streptomyces radiopugnans]|uniref:hypothetical protein n=1 Tax=Streptomyces radiopugnans TaxID=403935 RepID=UPI003F1B3802
MAAGQGADGGPNRLSTHSGGALSREEKDRLKAGFGQRLRSLLDMTGLSSREFAQRYPAYKDSTIRKYTLGTNLPPWDFLRDLLVEVSRRVDDVVSEERAAELFAAYRDVLVRIGADVRGSDQNSLLLRLYDGEQALHALGLELAEVREREDQLRAELEELRRSGPSGTADSAAQERRLTEESEALAQRRSALAQRRGDLLSDLDRTRAHLLLPEKADESAETSTATGGAAHHHSVAIRPDPLVLPSTSGGGQRRSRLVPALVGVLLLAAGITAGVLLSDSDGRDAERFSETPSTTPRSDTSEEEPPPGTNDSDSVTSGETTPGWKPLYLHLDQHLTDVYDITVSDGDQLDIDAGVLSGTGEENDLAVSGTLIYQVDDEGTKISPDVEMGLIHDSEVPYCAERARLLEGEFDLRNGRIDESVCVYTSENRWAVLQVAGGEEGDDLRPTELYLHIGFVP